MSKRLREKMAWLAYMAEHQLKKKGIKKPTNKEIAKETLDVSVPDDFYKNLFNDDW